MQALTLALLLALSATAEKAENLRVRSVAASRVQTASQMPPAPDPCAAAREIARQRPCLATGDCQALRLWRRSFGSPRVEPLDPTRAAYRPLEVNRDPESPPPDLHRRLTLGFVCPAGDPR